MKKQKKTIIIRQVLSIILSLIYTSIKYLQISIVEQIDLY